MNVRRGLCVLCLLVGGLTVVGNVSGLSYQNGVNLEFTFEPTLSIGLSSQDLRIDSLMPGSSGVSNSITVTVNSNNVTGYTLSANVGSSTNTTSDLTLDASNAFESLAVGSSVALADFQDNTWGYVLDSGTNYSGLADYASGDSTRLKRTVSSGSTNTIFKIAAQAADDQIAGDYTNKINFTVVTNYVPVSGNMQDITNDELAFLMPEEGDTAILTDKRDGKRYSVAKLADGNYWMTQNLDLDIDSSKTYTQRDTDIGWSDELGNYSVASWTPSSSTHATADTTWDKTNNGRYIPQSYDPGDFCLSGTPGDNTAATCVDGTNMNYSMGNRYSWTAAMAMNDSSDYIADMDPGQSICPAGWTLPKGGNATGSGSFAYLVSQQGLTGGLSGNIQDSPTYFNYGGGWDGIARNWGTFGYYWLSGVLVSEYNGLMTNFKTSGSEIGFTTGTRYLGLAVRCIARDVRLPISSISQVEYMQEFSELSSTELDNVKSSMTQNAQYQLKDSRDEKTYYISKLADGNVWMTQNLDLDLNSGRTYTSADTDISADWTPSSSTRITSDTTWDDMRSDPESYNPGDFCWDGVLGDNATTVACNQNGNHYHLGNYYNWTAAIAMNDSSGIGGGVDADQSICPAGWMLPKSGNETGSFAYLVSQQNLEAGPDSNVQNSPAYFVYGGGWEGTGIYVGGSGQYRSSVNAQRSSVAGFSFWCSSYDYNHNYEIERKKGNSVRCVAR